MKTPHKAGHAYDDFAGQRDTSEHQHLQSVNNIVEKRKDWKQKTKEEKKELKEAMYNHPSGKHAPDNSKFNSKF
jgi:hypothetical protein